MAYVQGFVVPVPADNKEAYREMAAKAWPLFEGYGALRLMEAWGDNVPDGKQTDFRRAVDAREGEVVVFSWIEWPDRATCDEASRKMQDDERMKEIGDMPFDGKRMIWGGFAPILDASNGAGHG
ncbi:DUF1428 domain-containing protein [Terrihabitans sp. B22-R8]|uniref:DUF1428 domain-containing protein n=1 Tax=Terrihabitans sp. B22-R8 TaxID=3425128 RepID=UPI00403C6D4E